MASIAASTVIIGSSRGLRIHAIHLGNPARFRFGLHREQSHHHHHHRERNCQSAVLRELHASAKSATEEDTPIKICLRIKI